MESIDIKVNTDEMHKSAIIYRDAAASFIYVCYHCGTMFKEIHATLLHIESHFQVVNIIVDRITDDCKEVKIEEDFAVSSENVKVELFEDDKEIVCSLAATSSQPINEDENEQKVRLTLIDSKRGKEIVKGKVKKIVSSVRKNEVTSKHPYRCHKCSISSRNMTVLRTHMLKKHTADELKQIFRCTECDDYFKNALELRVHVLTLHLKKKKLVCRVCSVQFDVSESDKFVKHLEKHKKWKTDLTTAIDHQNSDHTKYEEIDSFTEERFPCTGCTQKFYIRSNLDAHMKSIHSGRHQLQCPECHAIFTAHKFYYAHQLEHKRVGPNITEKDEDLLLANLKALVDERIIHNRGHQTNEHPFSCLICNFSSHTHYEIRTHIREKHVNKMFPPPVVPKQQFFCDFCGLCLKSKSAVRIHLQIHTNTKSFACKFCGKTFRNASNATIHERQHTGEKPYQCHVCGKAFVSQGLLNTHKRVHDDTTYPCHICGKSFNLPGRLWTHAQTHRENRDFECTICGKTFNTRRYLQRHKAVHAGKKHPCQYCGSEFNIAAGLRQHYKHKHKDKWEMIKQK